MFATFRCVCVAMRCFALLFACLTLRLLARLLLMRLCGFFCSLHMLYFPCCACIAQPLFCFDFILTSVVYHDFCTGRSYIYGGARRHRVPDHLFFFRCRLSLITLRANLSLAARPLFLPTSLRARLRRFAFSSSTAPIYETVAQYQASLINVCVVYMLRLVYKSILPI